MEKKPKLLDKKRIILTNDSPLIFKIIEQNLKNIKEYELITENTFESFLAKIFMTEPRLVILGRESLDENLTYAKHIRNNNTFADLPVIIITNPPPKESMILKNKILNFKVNYFPIPVNSLELTKVIRQFLEK